MPNTHKTDGGQQQDSGEVQAIRDSNPFSFRNIVVGAGLALFYFLAQSAYNGVTDGQRRLQETMAGVSAKVADMHDAWMASSFALTNLQQDVADLKAESKQAVKRPEYESFKAAVSSVLGGGAELLPAKSPPRGGN
jgi:hypothetical protein